MSEDEKKPKTPNTNDADSTIKGNTITGNSNAGARYKPPAFIPQDPNLWYFLINNFFKANNITDLSQRLCAITSELDSNALLQTAAILTSEIFDEETKLKKLKDRICSLYTESDDKKLDRVLEDLTLGDRKPSWLLREIRRLTGGRLPEDVVRRVWVKRLPMNVQTVVAVNFGDLDTLAEIADRVNDIQCDKSGPRVFELHGKREREKEPPNDLSDIKTLLTELCGRVKKLETSNSSNSRSRSRSPGFRDRSHSRTPGSRQNVLNNEGICWYHETYGEAAHRCRPNCEYQTKPAENSNSGAA